MKTKVVLLKERKLKKLFYTAEIMLKKVKFKKARITKDVRSQE